MLFRMCQDVPCVRTGAYVPARVCACVRASCVRVRVLREIAVDQQNAACSMFFQHIFSARRRRLPSPNAGRIRRSSRVCVICDAAVTSRDRTTSMTAAAATSTISLHVTRNVHSRCLLAATDAISRRPARVTTESSFRENTSTKTSKDIPRASIRSTTTTKKAPSMG